jgi:hypothetical protein
VLGNVLLLSSNNKLVTEGNREGKPFIFDDCWNVVEIGGCVDDGEDNPALAKGDTSGKATENMMIHIQANLIELAVMIHCSFILRCRLELGGE